MKVGHIIQMCIRDRYKIGVNKRRKHNVRLYYQDGWGNFSRGNRINKRAKEGYLYQGDYTDTLENTVYEDGRRVLWQFVQMCIRDSFTITHTAYVFQTLIFCPLCLVVNIYKIRRKRFKVRRKYSFLFRKWKEVDQNTNIRANRIVYNLSLIHIFSRDYPWA